MSAGTRHPSIEKMLREDGLWLLQDAAVPGPVIVIVSQQGTIRALSVDQLLDPDRFTSTATFRQIDLTGEDQAITERAFKKLAAVTLALLNENPDKGQIEALAVGDAIVQHAAKVKLTADLADLAQQRYAKALQFYADPKNWRSPSSGFAAQYDPEPSPVSKDAGKAAREALAWADPKPADLPCAT